MRPPWWGALIAVPACRGRTAPYPPRNAERFDVPEAPLLPTELRKLFLDLLKRLLSLFGASHLLGAADQYLHDVLLLRGQGCIQCGVIPLPVQ